MVAGVQIGLQNPITGRGIGYSGPASHQLCLNAPQTPRCQIIAETNQKYSMTTPGYNPENQYVQIFMEYGLLGLIPWLFCFGWLLWESLRLIFPYLKELKKGKKADRKQLTQLLIGIAFGLGLRGLALEGLMLHSFVDRMIVYPFMLLWGLRYGQNVLVQSEQKPN
ncbi:MAG: O-antigen ligase family protein [bacterium]|nr:O-antigen ligase family protein [bacterium]